MELNVPRDREGSFEPKFIEKHQTFDPDLERKITGMYARGMSTRDIQSQLEEFYGTEVSPALNAAFPKTQVQLCIVHQIRNSLRYLASKYHKEFVADLKQVYRAPNLEVAEDALDQLEAKWGDRCFSAVVGWRELDQAIDLLWIPA